MLTLSSSHLTQGGLRDGRFSRNGTIWNVPTIGAGSFRFDIGCSDHLGPLLGFIRDELAELGRRHRHRDVAEVGKPDLHSRIGKGGSNFLVEPLDDFGRSVLGCADPSK
jgi:hypothetical protein